MKGLTEYIVPVYDVDADEFTEYIGFIRTKEKLIRCRDCKFNKYNGTLKTLCPMQVYVGEYGFCSNGKPKEDTEA